MSWYPIILSSLSVAGLAACASGAPAGRASLAETFAEIQVHEAGIAHARAAAERPQTSCAERCEASASAGEHAARVCELARAAADADALTRCEHAQRAHGDVAAQTADSQCSCAPQARPAVASTK